MEPLQQQGSPASQQGGASDSSIDQLSGQQQWTNESSSESELIAINGQQHYYEPTQPMHYLPALKQTDKQSNYHYHNHHEPTATLHDEPENGDTHVYDHHHENPTGAELAGFAVPSLMTPPFDNTGSVFEYYPNEATHSTDGETTCYRPYAHYAHHPQHSPANGYGRYGEVAGASDYYNQRHYFEHQEDANVYQDNSNPEDHFGLVRDDESKIGEPSAITTTHNYYGVDADTTAETRLYEPSAETTTSILGNVPPEDYGHSRESSAPDSGTDQPGQQQWASESSSEHELLAINGHHYYDPHQMHYMPAAEKQPGGHIHHHHHHHHHHQNQHPHEVAPDTESSVFVETNLMTASFTSVSKYDAGGSLIEYYPSDTNYAEANCYRPYAHHTHQSTDGYHKYDYYGQQQTNETDSDEHQYFEQEEAKTYHLLKQSSRQDTSHYARIEDGKTGEQQTSMTELQPTTTATNDYYSTDTDTIPQVPRVSRLYDPNTEINSSLFDDVPAEDYRNEQVEDEEEDDEEVEEEEEEGEDSLMSSSVSTSTCRGKTLNNGARQRSRVMATATTTHHTAGQVKLARCSPETIERLKLFLQRRQQLRGQPLVQGQTHFRSCCASTSQAMSTLRARCNRQVDVEKNGPSRCAGGVVKEAQLEQNVPVSNMSSTNKTSSHLERPNSGCAYTRRSSTSGQINPKPNSLSSSPSSCNESTYDESSNPTSRSSTITTFHHHPNSTAAIMTENRQLRNRTIVITSSSSYPNDQHNNDDSSRDLKRHSYGLETRSSKRRRRQDSQDASA